MNLEEGMKYKKIGSENIYTLTDLHEDLPTQKWYSETLGLNCMLCDWTKEEIIEKFEKGFWYKLEGSKNEE